MNIVLLAGLIITAVTAAPVGAQLRSHPRGLWVLFFAEMWERFSYYGMRGLLFFFLTQHLLFNDELAQSSYGAYTALVYLLPLIGGYLADRYLGNRKAIAFGALLLVAGHLTMAIEPPAAQQTLTHDGRTYVFEAEGRLEERQARLIVDGEGYAVRADADGALEIVGAPAQASLPAVLAPGSFDIGVAERDPVGLGVFYLALALIAAGVGFLKANISSIVGQLYGKDDPRRDSGFTLYYYGINLGAFWASILCAWLALEFGWWAGFGLAGLGMLAGYVVFVLGRPLLDGAGEPPDVERLKRPVLGPLSLEATIYALSFLGLAVIWALMQPLQSGPFSMFAWAGGAGGGGATHPHIGFLLALGSIGVLAYLTLFMARDCSVPERARMLLALILIAASVVFWTLFEQAGSSLNAFAARNTDLSLGPVEQWRIGPLTIDLSLNAAQVQSFNAGFILLFAPIFAGLWAFLERRKLDPSDPMKFALALVQVGAGFLVLVFGAQFAGPDFKTPLIFLAIAYLLHTTGELFLSPVGLSMVTKLSPAAVVSTMMATWFLASSWAQFIGGLIAAQTGAETVAGQVLDPAGALAGSISVFNVIGWTAVVIGLVLALASPWLNRLSHGSR